MLQIKNNKLDVRVVIAVADMVYDFDQKITSATTVIANECKDVTDSDRCEAASKITDCCRETAAKKGFSKSSLM